MKIAFTGATGLIGRGLVIALARQGHEVQAWVRRNGSTAGLPCTERSWPRSESEFDQALDGADAVIHLAGEPVGEGRWTARRKKAIRDSRIVSTHAIAQALLRLPETRRPKVFVSASAIGYYGDRGDASLTEESSPGQGFLAEVVKDWEKEALAAASSRTRVVCVRTGIVLSREGGALPKMPPAVPGSGRQWMSWAHLEDVVRFFEFVLNDSRAQGPWNLAAPEPVRADEFIRQLARARRIPLAPKAPALILRAALGEMAELVLGSQRVFPARATQAGFYFKHPRLDGALSELYSSSDQRLVRTQFVPRPLPEVFEFFSEARNLETITPPWLNFHIVRSSTPRIGQGTEIDYKLRIHGVPVRWRSKIDQWKVNREFSDTQLKGPYSKWHHTHRFEEIPGGTLVHDLVLYRVPFGMLGQGLIGGWIRRDVETIFAFRQAKLIELFGRKT